MASAPHSGQVFFEYDYMNQTQNMSGTHKAPAGDNDDKQIRSNFFLVGANYTFNRDWTATIELPVTNRLFRTENDDGSGVGSFNHTAFGDIRIMGTYTGLSPDMSTGLTLGFKLPTGDWRYPGFDRDTGIGSGSTDILLGGYHEGALSKDGSWGYFMQAQFEVPFATQGGYRPGNELDGDLGINYTVWTSADGKYRLSPLMQLIGSTRAEDSGREADPPNSGYSRLLLSPGVEFDALDWKLYGDVEFPVYQYLNGDQLTAPALFKVVVSHRF
jgi:hypothetical protein